MISVVIPLYNKEAFIAETLESVLSQTYSNFEVIVVDDGSTDRSVAVVRSFSDDRISLFEKTNAGVSVARNYGVDQAKYPWIAFLDADDWWAPTFLEEVVKGFDQFPKELIFATGRSRVFKDQVERYAHEMLPEEGTTSKMSYFKVISNHLPLVNSSNVVLRKALFLETGGFRPGMRQHEDHDLWMRICAQNEVIFINENLSFYRKNIENSASQNKYSAKDFARYMQTMGEVLPRLSNQDKKYFTLYTNTYISRSFLIHYSTYTKKERNQLLDEAKNFLSSFRFFVLKFASSVSFLNLYGIFKKIKG
mgnify:CR=1 FL=1